MESFAADKVYMQPCKTPNWQRGGKDFVSVVRVNGKAMNRPLAALALGNSLGSNGLVEAELLAVADFDELEKRKAEVKGKIVYYHSMFDPTIGGSGVLATELGKALADKVGIFYHENDC